MAKKKTVLIALLLLLAAVAAGVVLLLRRPVDEDESNVALPGTGAAKAFKLIDRSEYDVGDVTIANELDTFTVKRVGGDVGWQAEDTQELPQQKGYYYELARNCSSLTATMRLDDVPSVKLAEHGLVNPASELVVSFTDGESYTLYIGNRIENEASRYFRFESESTVYVGNEGQFSYALSDRYAFVARELSPLNPDGATEADYICVTAKNDATFEFVRDAASVSDGYGNAYRYRQLKPFESLATSESVKKYFTYVLTFNAASVYLASPTEEQLSELGFDEPLTTLTVRLGDDESVIHLAADPDGGYYAVKQGVACVWNVVDYMVTWLGLEDDGVCTHYFAAPRLEDVNGVQATVAGAGAFAWSVTPDKRFGRWIASSANEDTLSTETSKALYKLLCSVNSDSKYDGPVQHFTESPTDNPGLRARIIFEMKTGEMLTVHLLDASAGQLAVYVNGQYTGYVVRERFVEVLEKGLENAVSGGVPDFVW